MLYVDTDSIFFKRLPNHYSPKLGDYLGEFTNEIDPTEGNHIIEFVSAGPKNYSYKLDTGITHSKVKGFSLNFSASKKIDFNRIKNIVCNMTKDTINVAQNTIIRDKKNWSVGFTQMKNYTVWFMIKESYVKTYQLYPMVFNKIFMKHAFFKFLSFTHHSLHTRGWVGPPRPFLDFM